MTRRLSLNPNLSDMIANLAADRNGLDSVAALLDIDGDRRAPSNSNILDRSSSRSRTAGPTSVEDEVRCLFRPRTPYSRLQNQPQQQGSQAPQFAVQTFNFGRHNDRRQRQQIRLKCGSGPFVKDLVLIPDPRIELVPRQGIKLKLIQDGFYKQGVQFLKEWSYEHILQKIRDVFHDKLTDSCSLELLHSVHQRLLPPSLEAGQQMTGYFITKICKDKPLYVRTSIGLLSNENEILQSVSHDVLDTSQSMDSTELSSPYLAENIHMSDISASSEVPESPEPNTVELSETSYMSDVQSCSTSENQPFPCVTEQVPEEISPNQQIFPFHEKTAELQIQQIFDFIESLVDILSTLESKVITSRKNIVNVHRDNVLDGGFRAFGRKSFDMWHELDVKFSGEDGIDAGGPQREFMRLALGAIKELPIFSGPDNAKMLVLDYKCLTECTYYKAGQMLAYFIIHRGPSPNFISHTLYMALAEGFASIQPTPNEICDYELRGQIAAASNEEAFKAAVFKAVELINFAGCMSLTLHFNQDGQTTLVKSLTKFVVCDRIQSPFEQFENGLQTLGLVDEIKKNKKQWKEVFIFTIKPLDALKLDNMFDVKWSTEGSNRKCIEERILVYWRDFLQDLEEGQGEVSVTLKDLLAFTTGADEVPALGFNFPLQLSFIHPEDLQDAAKCCTAGFPYANTCTMELKIPVVNDYNTFQRNMAAAISMTVTFTNQ